MKTANVEIKITAKVNGVDTPCELRNAKIIIEGDVVVKNVELKTK